MVSFCRAESGLSRSVNLDSGNRTFTWWKMRLNEKVPTTRLLSQVFRKFKVIFTLGNVQTIDRADQDDQFAILNERIYSVWRELWAKNRNLPQRRSIDLKFQPRIISMIYMVLSFLQSIYSILSYREWLWHSSDRGGRAVEMTPVNCKQ